LADVGAGILPSFLPADVAVAISQRRPFATGNWGCGANKGDPQLKSMIQWIAASYSGR